jgi:4-amino-4-deoxy-L-arabinose transferase-like glycosyltransferase
MADQIDPLDQLNRLPPDARYYTAAADSIRTNLNFQTQGVQIFGPGYPTMLAIMGGLVGSSPKGVIPLQILMASLGSVALAMLALQLTGDRRIALTSGLLNSLSLTGIGLANVLLSDSLFFLAFVVGLLLYLRGLKDDRWYWPWLSGLALGVCVLSRSVAVFSFVILFVLAVTYASLPGSSWRTLLRQRVKPFAVTTACLLVIAGVWVLRNHQLYGVTYLSQATPTAMARMAAVFRADVDGTPAQDTFQEFSDSLRVRTETTGNPHTAYVEVAREMFFGLIAKYPLVCLKAYLHMVDISAHSDWTVFITILPEWDRDIRFWTRRGERWGLNYRVAILSAIGWMILWQRKRRGLAVSLAVICLYFALLTGFNPWQGNRVFYPAQIAWSVLVAVALLWSYDSVRRRLQRWRSEPAG